MSEVSNIAAEAPFLQLLLAANPASENILSSHIESMNRKLPPQDRRSLEDIVSYGNYVLEALNMEIKRFREDFRQGEYWLAVIDRGEVSEFNSKLAMSKPHAAQLKDMLDLMFADKQLVGIDVAKLSSSTFSAKTDIIHRMLRNQYFVALEPEYEGQQRVIVSSKLLYSMEPYFKETYGDKSLFKCLGCRHWVLQGKFCSNKKCNTRLHDWCYIPYFRSQGITEGTCPECQHPI
ncbi:hypothetical protein DASB73_022290 [Starmerella bacillaris]|uniref:Non-structural maintenance of chromosomes element 1 homolog n=1 Tax=Starmerella bacillaris TaxID=1247836 RepID=A0AAV5RI74_STABA|nr:hypothetical protein DASB73_022290 [Starmerella bacillaris]